MTEFCLKAEKLSKSIDSLSVLDNWDLEVYKGERLAIIGPPGCGKTTFLRLVAQLEKPTNGFLQVNSQKSKKKLNESLLHSAKKSSDGIALIPSG